MLFNYSARLAEFGLWFAQLWGESLGKALDLQGNRINAGTTPLSCVGATDQHSLLQLFREGPADKVYGFVQVATGFGTAWKFPAASTRKWNLPILPARMWTSKWKLSSMSTD